MFTFLKRLFGKKPETRVEEASVETSTVEAAESAEYTKPLKARVMGNGSKVDYRPGGLYGCDCVWWVSEETGADGQPVYIRESREHMIRVPAALPFTAAGKLYRNLGQLSPQGVVDDIDTDVYGRQVLCYQERFPCFDSFDYLHEHRYYRWYFIMEDGKLTRVYSADESGWIFVTEDVENVERKCAELLKKHGWIE